MLRPQLVALVTLIGSVGVTNAWFRVSCTDPLVQERLDPIISPGVNPSNHVHTISGGSNFNPTYTYNNLRASSCTNCLVAQACLQRPIPAMIMLTASTGFEQLLDPKTKLFEPVPDGGLLVYYQNRGDGDVSNGGSGLKAFPPGLKMITGDPKRRTKKFPIGLGTQDELRERAIQWSCLRFTVGLPGYDDNGTGFPTTDCEGGLNARLHLPACWDGVNLDSADHVSHTAFLSGLDNGVCPTGFVYMMKLFFEVTWSVDNFSGRWNATTDKWPFVYSHGDPTGFGWHGDFQNGWDTTALQNAIDQCNNPNDQTGSGVTEACKFLTVNTADFANKCKIAPVVNEAINGTLTKLPGCNPLQFGPQDATIFTAATCPQ
ncbi:hypothetical protein B0H16DRAFT_1678161 [Mycena metata]|uniref:DUF1996 domain-containing protein n=1 Tax=Mycena metata TaxID=1033252 RepID=A0AAD7HE64_9AGAR|nr:hypothetical protein B0H16DRAFT_1678161 [Mycena metata]